MYRAESHGKMARVGSSWMKDVRALPGEVHYAEVMQQMCAEPLRDLVLAALATAACSLVLTGYDLSATTAGLRAFKLGAFAFAVSAESRRAR